MPSKIRGGNNDKHMADTHYPRVSSMAKPGGAAFAPTDLTNLLVWAKADAGVFTDTGRTTPAVNDGDAVKGWTDQSGNANHLSNATGMTLKLNIQNGKPILRGNGTTQSITTASIAHNIGTGDFYVAVMVIPRAAAGASKPIAVWASVDNGAWDSSPLQFYDGATKSFNSTLASGTAYILEMWRASGTTFAVLNGTQEANTPASSASLANGSFAIAGTAGVYLQADYGEVIFCKHAQDATARANVRSYLNGRWATY